MICSGVASSLLSYHEPGFNGLFGNDLKSLMCGIGKLKQQQEMIEGIFFPQCIIEVNELDCTS